VSDINCRASECVTITDVARLAGVAPMTVSRVINSPGLVAPATAERVREAIAHLGYVPNLMAGGLSSRRSRMVAAVVPTISHPMFATLIDRFTATLREAGYQVMLSLTGYADPGAEDELVPGLLGRRPDGLLITGVTHSPATRQVLAEAGIPVVEIFDMTADPIDMLVGFDHDAVGAAAAEYFLARGHDTFAMFAAGDRRAMARRRGFVERATAGGGRVVDTPILPAPSTITAGRGAMRALAPRLNRRTALFCSSDLLAFGAIIEARQHGIAVPNPLAVCGFGDFEIAAANEPPVTTITVEAGRIGQDAADIILACLAGDNAQQCIEVPFRIVHRASS
jgi:LacI family transcriptional regulator, gluconate utilization system Gnt-I transcriptional repressor